MPKKNYSNLSTTILGNNQNYIPFDYSDFVSKSFSSDEYNFQLYSDIIKFLGINYVQKDITTPIKNLKFYENNINPKSKVLNFINFILSSCNKVFHSKRVILTDVYFKYGLLNNMLKILIKGKLKYLFDDFKYKYKIPFKIDKEKRKKCIIGFDSNEFEKLFSELFFKNIPWLFLEGYNEFKEFTLSLPIKEPNVIFSANGIHGNNILKFYYAEKYKKINLLYIMHGGYGFDYYNTPEEYEISCADSYYSIGEPQNTSLKHLPYMGMKSYNNTSTNEGHILYAISEMSRFVYRIEFHAMSDSYLKYNLNWTQEVLKNLTTSIPIKIRMQSANNSFHSLNKIIEQNPQCRVDNFSNSFEEELKKCKLYITNNIATTYLESMSLNKPTIVMISKNVCLFREYSQPYMNMLKDVGILHYSPESVINHINKVYDNIDDWWLSKEVQEVRNTFLKIFMKDDKNWIDKWIIEFNKNLNITKG